MEERDAFLAIGKPSKNGDNKIRKNTKRKKAEMRSVLDAKEGKNLMQKDAEKETHYLTLKCKKNAENGFYLEMQQGLNLLKFLKKPKANVFTVIAK